MKRTKDGLIPAVRLIILADKPNPDGMTAAAIGWADGSLSERVTMTTDNGIVLGSGVIVAVIPEDA